MAEWEVPLGDVMPDTTCVPDPLLSVIPECLRVSPDGALDVPVQILFCDGTPGAFVDVRLIIDPACQTEISGCDGATVYTVITNGAGDAVIEPLLGGCCVADPAAIIEADPGAVTILPRYETIGSPDNDADLMVQLDDFVRFQGAFLGSDACHDLSGCDEDVMLSDFVVFQGRFLARCP